MKETILTEKITLSDDEKIAASAYSLTDRFCVCFLIFIRSLQSSQRYRHAQL